MAQRAVFRVLSGPNSGDEISLDLGTCRLVGRHLAEAETAFIDREGNRVLDGSAGDILREHLHDRAPAAGTSAVEGFSDNAFERGADVILGDSSVSRAHAMLFHDSGGVGVIDLASTNGTFIGGRSVSSAMLQAGEMVTIGTSELKLSVES
jgi:hypothetical protein